MASPVGKAGPIRATQVFSLTSLGSSGSFTQDVAGHLKTKRSSSDRLQSGSPVRERKSGSEGSSTIRKSRSVDAVTSNCYLNGEWPRADSLVAQAYFCPSNLTSDRSTQTPQEWCRVRSSKSSKSETSGRSVSVVSTDSLKTIKACLTRSSRDSTRHGNSGLWQMTSTHSTPNGFTGIGLALPSKPIAVPDLQWNRSLVRSSPDSLCQEIEKLAMTANAPVEVKLSSGGRCAPVAQQLKMCSAVTQTPLQFAPPTMTRETTDSLLLPTTSFECSGHEDNSFKGNGSPELVRFASPQALTDRLAPEGCEKVCGKFKEISTATELIAELASPLKAPSGVCHIPSETSAFNPPPLIKNYLSQPTQLAKKMNSVIGINN